MNPATIHAASPLLEIIREAETHKGRIHTIATVRDCKTRTSYDGPRIRKRMVFSARVGHAYENQAAVMEKHESGEREKMGLPPWCEYVSPALRRHKTSGREYLAFQPIGIPKVEFEKDGKVVTKEEIAPFLLASETKETSERPDWITVGLDTVTNMT